MDVKNPDSRKLLFIETGNNPSYTFNNFLTITGSLGFEPTFVQCHQVDTTNLDAFGTIVLNVDHSLFKASLAAQASGPEKPPQPFITVTKQILQGLATLTHKKIIFALPSSALAKRTADNNSEDTAMVTQLLRASNNAVPEQAASALDTFLSLAQKLAHRRHTFATTLMQADKRAMIEKCEEAQEILRTACREEVVALPSPMSAEPAALAPLWPHGIMWQNRHNNNSVLLTEDSRLNFADIGENYYINPLDRSLRLKLVSVMHHMLQQFLIDRNAPVVKIPTLLSNKYARDTKQFFLGKRAARTYAPSHAWLKEKPVSCAWMDVKSFHAKGPESLDAILHAGINVLWLDLIPEIFLAKNARCAERKEELLSQVGWLTRNLQERAWRLGKPVPRLFMGTDITLNYRTVPVDVAAVDLYGTKMPKIPSPVNLHGFWKTQVIDVIDSFITEWEEVIGNCLPLSGIFFDFEMYQAPEQASNFTSIMDFSDMAWQTFLEAYPIGIPDPSMSITVAERVQYLIDHKLMDAYYHALYGKAGEIGRQVRDCIKARLPHAVIGVYNANIPSNWWYRGFMSHASRPDEPLICATFNTDFFSHAERLEANGVFLHHLQVLMLSKLRTPDDFKQIDTILRNHDGIWFNRFSRLAEDPQGNADHIESSPLPANEVARRIGEHLNKK